jgi:DNA-binding MarR family transcriptional regulator
MKKEVKRQVIISTEKAGNSTFQRITDFETGEVYDETYSNKAKPGRKKSESAYFVKLYRNNLIKLVKEKAKEKRLDLDEAGLLFILLSIVGWQTPYIVHPDTGVNMSCSEIAEYIGRDRAHIHDLLERLVLKGMVSKIFNGNGRANYYMFNPNIAFYGRTIDDTKHLDIFKTCPFEPQKYIEYRKTPAKKK